MTDRARPLALAAAAALTVAVVIAWWVLRGGDDDPQPPSGPAARVGGPVMVSDSDPLVPDPTWVAKTGAEYAIPARAMQAYATAELLAEQQLPACGLHWNTIAGIGSVESAHGTLGGAGLDAAGVPSKKIIGPALDGTNGTRAIKATEVSTKYHGDDEWDHAVGPFQFLTSSWVRYGADADGDGVNDPEDIDDAALGAAYHLCETADGTKRSVEGDGWVPAVFSYNNSMAYVKKVRSIADSYAR